jgi:hypothetical protein
MRMPRETRTDHQQFGGAWVKLMEFRRSVQV